MPCSFKKIRIVDAQCKMNIILIDLHKNKAHEGRVDDGGD